MTRGIVLIVGCVLTFTSSWLGLIYAPYLQVGGTRPIGEGTAQVYPRELTEEESRGRAVYVANGCIYCHSQQVRGPGYGTDIARGWGTRRTVPRDYINDRPLMLGTMRTGPDLSNVGQRWSRDWHLKHLYNPRMTSPGSIMPSFVFLFDVRPVSGSPSADALALPSPWAIDGMEVVPTVDAKALAAYLLSLDKSFDLPEAKE